MIYEVKALETCVLSAKALICWIGSISYVSPLATRRLSSEHLGEDCLPVFFEQVRFFARIAIRIADRSGEARGSLSCSSCAFATIPELALSNIRASSQAGDTRDKTRGSSLDSRTKTAKRLSSVQRMKLPPPTPQNSEALRLFSRSDDICV